MWVGCFSFFFPCMLWPNSNQFAHCSIVFRWSHPSPSSELAELVMKGNVKILQTTAAERVVTVELSCKMSPHWRYTVLLPTKVYYYNQQNIIVASLKKERRMHFASHFTNVLSLATSLHLSFIEVQGGEFYEVFLFMCTLICIKIRVINA